MAHVTNPCCMPLQKGVKILAVIGVVVDCITVILTILAILAVTVWKDASDKYLEDDYDVALGTLIVGLIIAILGLLLSIRLYVGAKNRDRKNCKIWLIVTLVLTIIDLISYIVNGAAGSVYTASLAFSIVGLLYTIYKMWVVYAFIQEIKEDNTRLGFQSRLEEGTATAYPMNSYPSPYVQQHQGPGYAVQQPQGPGYAVQQPYPTQGNGYVLQHNMPNNNQQVMYNPNNHYVTTGNI